MAGWRAGGGAGQLTDSGLPSTVLAPPACCLPLLDVVPAAAPVCKQRAQEGLGRARRVPHDLAPFSASVPVQERAQVATDLLLCHHWPAIAVVLGTGAAQVARDSSCHPFCLLLNLGALAQSGPCHSTVTCCGQAQPDAASWPACAACAGAPVTTIS